jgi:beta-ring hydroxylase
VYTTLREAEYRSTYPIPYWNFPPLRYLVPRQRQCTEALAVINSSLDELIAKCKKLVSRVAGTWGAWGLLVGCCACGAAA